jgi:hypothetical protein
MGTERKNGVGSLASGVLERLTPRSVELADEGSADPPAEVETTRGRGVARKSKASAGPSSRQDVKGRTIYLPESLFERIMVQAHRKKRTISEYVAGILERQVPDYRTAGRADAGDDAA